MPGARNVIEGRRIDADVKQAAKLPFDAIALLSETSLTDGIETGGSQKKYPSWKISIVADGQCDSMQHLARVHANTPDVAGPGFWVWSVVLSPQNKHWQLWPGYAFCALFEDRDGYMIHPWTLPGIPPINNLAAEFADDMASVLNLCVMLSLHNVSKERRDPPTKVNKKRLSNNKVPLFDYHVLKVDGDAWDSPTEETGQGSAYRSHLRRGHIRNLVDGRKVFVRATFVHGAVPGFVAKDYLINNKAPA